MLDSNFKKRDDFYKKLSQLEFSACTTNLDLKTFKINICKSLGFFAQLCSNTLQKSKGSKTRDCLRLMNDCTSLLKKHIESINDSESSPVTQATFVKITNEFKDLINAIYKTSKTHFLTILNSSTLDYKPTKEYFKELNLQLKERCFEFCGVINKHNFDILYPQIDNAIFTPDSNLKILKIKEPLFFCYLSENGPLYYTFIVKDNFDSPSNLLTIFKHLNNKFSAFTEIRTKLEKTIKALKDQQKINLNGNQICDNCKKEDKTLVEIDSCHHQLCPKCLRKALDIGRCLKCDSPINKAEILAMIESTSILKKLKKL